MSVFEDEIGVPDPVQCPFCGGDVRIHGVTDKKSGLSRRGICCKRGCFPPFLYACAPAKSERRALFAILECEHRPMMEKRQARLASGPNC